MQIVSWNEITPKNFNITILCLTYNDLACRILHKTFVTEKSWLKHWHITDGFFQLSNRSILIVIIDISSIRWQGKSLIFWCRQRWWSFKTDVPVHHHLNGKLSFSSSKFWTFETEDNVLWCLWPRFL